jgi:hypothetical protein
MNVKQLRDALDYINPDGTENEEQQEEELTFLIKKDNFISEEGEKMNKGIYCFLTEYPEEGIYGPLGS